MENTENTGITGIGTEKIPKYRYREKGQYRPSLQWAVLDLGGEQYGASFECRLGESVSREIFFFLTGHGSFVSHSRRYNDELAVNCRFCGIFEESPEHLLLHCAAFESLEINQDTEMSIIETRCRFIAKQISRL